MTMQLISDEKDCKHVSVTLNIYCTVACLTFHLPHITTVFSRPTNANLQLTFFRATNVWRNGSYLQWVQSDEKVVTFWDDVGDTLWFPTHLPNYVYSVPFRRHLPLDCRKVAKLSTKCLGAQIFWGGWDTPNFGHTGFKSHSLPNMWPVFSQNHCQAGQSSAFRANELGCLGGWKPVPRLSLGRQESIKRTNVCSYVRDFIQYARLW